jgi:integrase
MAFKRCHETGCVEGRRFHDGKAATARCAHRWYLRVMVDGISAHGPVTHFVFLLRPTEPVPTNKGDADDLEQRLRRWMADQLAGGHAIDWQRLRQRPAPDPNPNPPHNPSGPTSPPPPADPTPRVRIAAAVATYQTKHIAKMGDNSATYLAARIGRDVGTRPIADLLDVGLIEWWLDDLREEEDTTPTGTRKDSTLNRYRARWSNLITFCRTEFGLVGQSPFYHPILNPASPLRRLKEQRRTRRLRPEHREEQRLLKATRTIADGGQMTGRVLCGIDAGLRRREMLLVDVDHLQRDRTGLAIVIPADHTKSKQERKVPIASDRLRHFLQGRIKRLARTFGQVRGPRRVFGQADGSPLDAFRNDWEAVLMAGGFRRGHYVTRKADGARLWEWTVDENLHWHDLRHECGSRLAEGYGKAKPLGIPQLMKLLGHTKPETTMIYLNMTDDALAAAMKRVNHARGL